MTPLQFSHYFRDGLKMLPIEVVFHHLKPRLKLKSTFLVLHAGDRGSIRGHDRPESRNKRPMGHIAHLRKQFKSFNKYDNIITLIQRIKKILYENVLLLSLNKPKSPSPKDALCQVWLKLAQGFWRKRFLNSVNVFLLFV